MSAKKLVIVESPAKAKTISKFLGKEYKVLASYGHVRDLPKSDIGVDINKDFKPKYELSKEKFHTKAVKEIKAAYKEDTEIYIATDEDREGEAIGWHLLEILKPKNRDEIKRIVFHEITKSAILEALEHPRHIDENLVNAQQARRILDRLVGYELSPLLWKKIRYGLSAGRVQSAAVRLIVEKEEEINAFKVEEYWDIHADLLSTHKESFTAKLLKKNGENIDLKNEQDTKKIVEDIKDTSFKVQSINSKDTKKYPAPPFITSTLQQEASRKLGLPVKVTMQIAQALYEGMDVGNGPEGLITYMRTDSVTLSNIALNQAQKVIEKEYGKEYTLSSPRFFKNKKSAQEAHEAIRPVNLMYTPESIRQHLNDAEYKVYKMIWDRTIASQMPEAQLKNTSVDIAVKEYTFRATGQQIIFPGFMKIYIEGTDEESKKDENMLPMLQENEELTVKKITPAQHFTKPPARYTEASLVKKLEELGIGRPSTYAPTISTIQSRGYIEMNKKQLVPTDTATVVTKVLKEHFTNIVDYPFTASMEQKLDDIAEGTVDWVKMLHEFYNPFHKNIEEKDKTIKKSDITSEEIGEKCPECGNPLVKKLSRFGMFISCSNYPECKYSRKTEGGDTQERELGIDPISSQKVIATTGRFGPYVKLVHPEGDKKKEKMVSIIPPFSLSTITLEEACQLLTLPRTLGQDTDGTAIMASNGRFGPYVQKDKEYRSLPNDGTVLKITLEEALKLLAEPKKSKRGSTPGKILGKHPKSGKDLVVKTGKFGPYVSDGKINATIPKDKNAETLTLEEATQLINAKTK